MAVPGVLCALSKNIHPELVDSDTLIRWYDNIHIPDVLATTGVDICARYEAMSPNAPYSTLVVYPVSDIHFVASPEFQSIRKGGHDEIRGHDFPDLAKIDLRISESIDLFEPHGSEPDFASCLVVIGISPGEGQEDEFNSWYREEYFQSLSKINGFRRARRYLVTTAIGREDAPKFLAFHEFDSVDLPLDALSKARETPRAAEIFRGAGLVEDWPYKLAKVTRSG